MRFVALAKKALRYGLIVIVVFWIALLVMFRPSHDRDWSPDQAVLPSAEFQENLVHIKNIRNFTYRSTTDYDADYYDKTFDLSKLSSMSYIVEPFSGYKGAAHTFLSFGFDTARAEKEYVSISVEIRKEKGESFSALKGLLRQFELMYVVADERDVVQLRSNYRKDLVYVYPVKTTPEKMRAVFVDMLERANRIKEKPEFYNTLTNNCTENIAYHVNKITPRRIPLNLTWIFPSESDHFAYDLGLIDTDLPFFEARKKFLINERAEKFADDPQFSKRIRSN